MNDLQIRTFENQLIELINGVPLPLEVKRLVVAETLGKLETATEKSIADAISQLQKVKEEQNVSADELVAGKCNNTFEHEQNRAGD